jgi:tRNA dimethylallyltransferase
LAKQLDTEVISADSRQFYKEMSIGTAKPTSDEQNGVIHHFIDSHSVTDEVTAARFAREAEKLLAELFQKKDFVVLTGGSGMFVDALLNGIDDIPTSEEIKKELIEFHKQHGLQPLLDELKEKDPLFYDTIDRNNPARVIRALEAIRITGKAYSVLRKGSSKERIYNIKRFIIDHDRGSLYARINLRVDLMISHGLLEEAKTLLTYRDLNPLRTVGYTELFEYFDGKISLDRAIELIKQHSRNYAKRQLTWLNRYDDATHIAFADLEQMTKEIMNQLK